MTEPGLRIAPAEAEDFLDIAALDHAAWSDNRHGEFIPDGEHVWRVWCEHALVYVARAGADLAGAVLAFPTRTEGLYCLHKAMVDARFRGRGVGSKLFEALLAEFDRLGVDAFLTVDPVNERAIALYEKWGFAEKQLVRGYYRAQEDRYVMIRRAGGGD
jgi:[ribosomal protein S18]-alanine N-acetyltransferase